MSLNILSTVVFLFALSFLASGFSMAQDKSGSNKMDGHMKMDHSKMEQKKDMKEFDLKALDKNNDGKIYQCPMDFDVLSDEPGKDPKCGMALEEVTLEQAKSNLIKNGFKVSEENAVPTNGVETASVWNKYCPVSGMKINSESPTVEYNGHTIGFCCPGHKHNETFLKDPEKYMKNLSSDGQEFIGEKP